MSEPRGCLDCGVCGPCVARAEAEHPGRVKARAVGNAVFIEADEGNVASWGAASREQAEWIAETLNETFEHIRKGE